MSRKSINPVKINAVSKKIRIGIDTGGTFTDFVIFKDGRFSNKKILSTPAQPAEAILAGLAEFMDASKNLFIIHGTTVGTNALLERKGGRIALLTTAGFEDVVFIGRQTRKNLYSLTPEARLYPLPQELSFGVNERVLASGEVVKKINRQEIRKILDKVKKAGVEAVAVCFLHSYKNSDHEKMAGEEVAKAGLIFSLSSDLLPEHREFERTMATVINTYLMPVMDKYLKYLSEKVGQAELRIMQSNEGYIKTETARRQPVKTAFSGPAGGVVGAFQIARTSGFNRVISFDMGGTSTDVSLIDGSIRRTYEARIGDFPVRLPMIDIHSVGAGGGSIAYVDRGGSLRVGPQSAGADPGPACYGKGEWPTVTDANLLLGRLFPDYFLGGRMKIQPVRSRLAISSLAKKLNKSAVETALGIISIANANMEKAVRVISVERGFDPRDFILFSFGGAGGMHAAEMALNLGIKQVVVPRQAGVLSAFGLLMADSIKDFMKSVLLVESEINGNQLDRLFLELEELGRSEMAQDGFEDKDIIVERSLDCRYLGQSYEINVPYKKESNKSTHYAGHFHRLHRKFYSYHHPGRPVEIVNIRVKVIALTPEIPLPRDEETKHMPPEAVIGRQPVFTPGGKLQAVVYDRTKLLAGNSLAGPSLVIDPESTSYIPPDFKARVDRFGNLIISRRS